MDGSEWGTETAQTYSNEPRRETALSQLDAELERLDKTVAFLTEKLGPVLSQYSEPMSEKQVMEEPASDLRRRVIRVRLASERLDSLMRQLDI